MISPNPDVSQPIDHNRLRSSSWAYYDCGGNTISHNQAESGLKFAIGDYNLEREERADHEERVGFVKRGITAVLEYLGFS